MYLAYLLAFFCIHIWYIFGNSLWLRSGGQHSAPGLAVWVRRGTLRSSACSWGLAGNTPILILLFGSGGEHCDLALVVAVRRWSLWSWACCPGPAGTRAINRACSWGPAGMTLIQKLLFGSGGDHCEQELVVEVQRRSRRRRRRRRRRWRASRHEI